MGNRILPIYCSRSLARQYIILQYAALIYCNNGNYNMYVVHIAIYCNILIYRNILPIYCNILYIATIYRTLQQYIVYCNIYSSTIPQTLLLPRPQRQRLSQSMKMDGFEKLEIDPNPKKLN